jgi:hypothetical protein
MKPYGIVYRLYCVISGRDYIGQTIGTQKTLTPDEMLDLRWYGHMRDAALRSERGCIKLYRAILKYEPASFERTVLAVVENYFSEEENQRILDSLEITYIKKYDAIKTGYNIREGGSKGKCSESTKKKLSEINKKAFPTSYLAQRMAAGTNYSWAKDRDGAKRARAAANSYFQSDACRAQVSNRFKGVPKTEEHRKHISTALAADLSNKTFGQWTVLNRGPNSEQTKSSTEGRVRWYCRCSCGNVVLVRTGNLLGGLSTKCQGCANKQSPNIAHFKLPVKEAVTAA